MARGRCLLATWDSFGNLTEPVHVPINPLQVSRAPSTGCSRPVPSRSRLRLLWGSFVLLLPAASTAPLKQDMRVPLQGEVLGRQPQKQSRKEFYNDPDGRNPENIIPMSTLCSSSGIGM